MAFISTGVVSLVTGARQTAASTTQKPADTVFHFHDRSTRRLPATRRTVAPACGHIERSVGFPSCEATVRR